MCVVLTRKSTGLEPKVQNRKGEARVSRPRCCDATLCACGSARKLKFSLEFSSVRLPSGPHSVLFPVRLTENEIIANADSGNQVLQEALPFLPVQFRTLSVCDEPVWLCEWSSC